MSDLTSFRGIRSPDPTSDLQSGIELVSEAVEQKSNEIKETVTQEAKGITDAVTETGTATTEAIKETTEAGELVAETIENKSNNIVSELGKLNEYSSKLNDKMKAFAGMMEQKFNLPRVQTSLDAIEEVLQNPPEPAPQINPEPLLPEIPQGHEDTLPAFPQREDTPKKEPKKKKDDKDADFGEMLTVLRGGFKQTIAVTDKILSTLFKMSLSAAAEMAKWGAILLSLVLAVDTIMVHFRYWSEQFNTKFENFIKEAGGWVEPISKILTAINDVRDFWESGDYFNAFKSAFMGIVDAVKGIGIEIGRIVSNVIASMLRAMGKDEWADAIEYAGLQRSIAQGHQVNEREAELVSRVRAKEEREEAEAGGGRIQAAKDFISEWNPFESKEDQKEREERQAGYERRRVEIAAIPEEKLRASKKSEVKHVSAINAASKATGNLKAGRDSDKLAQAVEFAAKKRTEIESDATLLETDRDDLLKRLDALTDALNAKMAQPETVKPVPPQETQEGAQVEQVAQAQVKAQQAPAQTNNTSNVNTVNNVSNQKIIRQAPVQTNIPAPGMIPSGLV